MNPYDPYNLFSALNVGIALIFAGFLLLGLLLPIVAKKWEASISIFAQKASFALVIVGLILIILHFLYLMELIPWWRESALLDILMHVAY